MLTNITDVEIFETGIPCLPYDKLSLYNRK